MTEDDRNRFDAITSHNFEGGVSPEARQAEEDLKLREKYTQLIGRLDAEQLGRAIVITKKEDSRTVVRRTHEEGTDFAIETQPGQKQSELCGYILALNNDNTEHLMVFTNGVMLTTKAATPSPEAASGVEESYKEQYETQFSPSASPFLPPSYISHRSSSVTDIIDDFKRFGENSKLKVTHENTSLGDQELFNTYFDQAFSVATELKAERDKARRSTMKSFVEKFDAFLNPKPPSHEPPSGPPTPPSFPPQG